MLAGVITTLFWAVWGLGGIKVSLQYVTAGLSVLTFLLMFVPMGRSEAFRGSAHGNWRRLLRFPIFWLGLFFFGYIALQAFNARFYIHNVGKGYVLEQLPYIEWLPTSIMASMDRMNPWRMVLLLFPAWLLGCTVWAGLPRRRAMRPLLWFFALNGFVWTVTGMLLRVLAGREMMLGFFHLPGYYQLFGTMLNPNHAAAFINMCMAAQIGLFLHLNGRNSHNFLKGGPHLILLPMVPVMAMAQLQIASRAGMALCAVILLILVVLGFLQLIKIAQRGGHGVYVGAGALFIMATIAGLAFRASINVPQLQREVESLRQVFNSDDVDMRVVLNRATMDMIRERLLYGWGAGSYRYYIPTFQQHYPELMLQTRRGTERPWIYAHNDYLQYPAELGLLGVAPIVLGLLYLLVQVLRNIRRLDFGMIALLLGLIVVASHAWVDFLFFGPVLIPVFGVLVLSPLVILRSARK